MEIKICKVFELIYWNFKINLTKKKLKKKKKKKKNKKKKKKKKKN